MEARIPHAHSRHLEHTAAQAAPPQHGPTPLVLKSSDPYSLSGKGPTGTDPRLNKENHMARSSLKPWLLSCLLTCAAIQGVHADLLSTQCQPGNGITAVGTGSCVSTSDYGTVESIARIDGNRVGAFTAVVDTATPSPSAGYNARALALLEEKMRVDYPSASAGTLNFSVPVSGSIDEASGWNQSVRLSVWVAATSNPEFSPDWSWDRYYTVSGSINETIPLSIPVAFNKDFYFFTSLLIDGAANPGPADGYANFLNTVVLQVTGIETKAAGGDVVLVPLSSLQSGRSFTDGSTGVPEPASFFLLGAGLGALGLAARRRKGA